MLIKMTYINFKVLHQSLKINTVPLDYTQVVKMLTYAKTTGDWNLHLHAIYKMLNLHAARGIYTKRKVQ